MQVTDRLRTAGIASINSQHTLGHLECPACEQMRAMYLKSISPGLDFPSAAELYMQQRTIDATPGAISARYIRETTEQGYRQHIRVLSLFFTQSLPIEKIHIGMIKSYQAARLRGDEPVHFRKSKKHPLLPSPVKPAQVNKEVRFLIGVMRRANCWSAELEEIHEELQGSESEVPRALSEEEQRLWIEVSRLKPRWEMIHWYSLVAFDTTMSTNEIRGLRIGDVNLHHGVVSVPWPAAKNKYRHRSIALDSADCMWAFDQLLARAHDMGAVNPQHYLFPIRDKSNQYDPTRHMTRTGIKQIWDEVRVASGLKWFRPYDTRHTAITRLAETGVPIEIIKSKAGHISDKMSRHYTHISLAAQRRWMQFSSELRKRPTGEYNPYTSQMPAHPMFRSGSR